MLPDIFIMPESDPACLPPTSIQAAQAPGITRSLEKLARPMLSIAIRGSFIRVESSRNMLAPVNPMYAMMRRGRALLPTHGARPPALKTPARVPPPPTQNQPRPAQATAILAQHRARP